ncbi:MAG: hypothetical protein MI673_01995 [Thiotrichales bacterium]|nr:hypothetical protein [Thiotrichales bacterium]
MHSKIVLLFVSGLLMSCSGEDGTGSGDHVWKDQVDTIERAREAEQKMQDAIKLQQQAIERQTQ